MDKLISQCSNVAMCIDTCHAFQSGVEFINIIPEIQKIFGKLNKLSKVIKLFHLNGSDNLIGKHKDHHVSLFSGDDNMIDNYEDL